MGPATTENVAMKFDVSDLTLGDVEELMNKEGSFTKKLEILSRITVEGDIRLVRVKDMPAITEEIEKAMNEMLNPTPMVSG